MSELLDLLGAETKAPAWPNVAANTATKNARKGASAIDIEKKTEITPDQDIKGMSTIQHWQICANTLQLIRDC